MADFRTSQATVFKLVRDATAEIPRKREKLSYSYDDEVYRVTTHEENNYIVRIQHEGDVPYAQQAWAMEQAHQVGAPVPKVVWAGEKVLDGLPRGVMVLEDQTGEPLDVILPKLGLEHREMVFRQAGEALAKIHRIPVGGFQRRHAGGSWDFYSWEDFLTSAVRNHVAGAAHLVRGGVPQDEVDATLTLLETYRDNFSCEQPVLCHGDFHPSHLLANPDGSLAGVTDLGDFQGGHPIHDIAYFSLTCPQVPLQFLKVGYGSAHWWDDASFPTRLLLHKNLLVLGYLIFYITEGYDEDAAPMRTALTGLVAEARTMGLLDS